MGQLTFAQPQWFWALASLPLLAVLFLRNERLREKLLGQFVATRLVGQLAGGVSIAKRRCRVLLMLLSLACAITSLVQPRYGFHFEEKKARGTDVVIAIDTSKSMRAQDIPPSRLERAKLAAQDLVNALEGNRVGVVAYAGMAFLQAPLTLDYVAVTECILELDTEIIPRGSTNIGEAIEHSRKVFIGEGDSNSRALVIFTDGEDLEGDAIKAARKLSGEMRIFTVGIGTTEGTLIPLPASNGGTQFVKDREGQVVKSKLDEARLRQIAEVTNGSYLHLQRGVEEMGELARNHLSRQQDKELKTHISRVPIEGYQWPLAASVILLSATIMINERKRSERSCVVVLRNPARVQKMPQQQPVER